MNWEMLIRQTHRWLSIIFTLTVIANFIALGAGSPALWLNYLPLPPLFLLMFSGLYMFVQPYAARWRGERRARGVSANQSTREIETGGLRVG